LGAVLSVALAAAFHSVRDIASATASSLRNELKVLAAAYSPKP